MIVREPSLGHQVNRAARLFRRLADRRLEPLGLSSGHLPVLTALMDGEAVSQKAVSQKALSQKALTEIAGIEQPTMAATLSRMERDGLIRREPDPHDRRSVRFSLTATTQAKLPAIRAAVDTMTAEALAAVPGEGREAFTAMLGTMIAWLERAVEGKRAA